MIYREYGKTGKKVSLLGFGAMRFEDPDNRDLCVEMVVEAAKLGINYFDTAPAYFGTKSEEIIGQGFKELKRLGLPFYSATKTFKSASSKIRAEIDSQLKRLNLETIDFYHIWCVTSLKNWRERKQNGTIEAFVKLKEEGLIRHICVSSHLINDEIKEILAAGVIEGVLLGYSAYNFSMRQAAIDLIAGQGLGCTVMNPLGGGIIPQNPAIFNFIKTRKSESLVEAALHFLFAHHQINTSLVGFSELKEIKEAVQAVENYIEIPKSEIERIKEGISESFNDICTGCQYCDNCPAGIPIPRFLDSYNHKIFYNDNKMIERLKYHWELNPEQAAECTACGECEDVCTQHLPIIKRLAEIAALSK